MTRVFQYGSNALAARFNGPRRLNGHADDLGRAETLDDLDISFDNDSQTNGCATANLVPAKGRRAWGVVYEIPDEFVFGVREDGQRTLFQIEGPTYEMKTLRVMNPSGTKFDAITFVVKATERRAGLATSAAFVSWVVYGLRGHGVPEEYVKHVVEIARETNLRAGHASTKEQLRLIDTL